LKSQISNLQSPQTETTNPCPSADQSRSDTTASPVSTAPEIPNSKFLIPNSPSDPSDDPIAHIKGLLAGTIPPSWIPAEIPCDDEEHFLDLMFPDAAAEGKARAAAAKKNKLSTGETSQAQSPNPSTGGTSPARSASLSTVLSSGSPTSISRDALTATTAAPADLNPQAVPVHPSHPENPVKIPSSPSASANSASAETTPSTSTASETTPAPNSEFIIPNSELHEVVDRYTVRRTQEYWAHRRTCTGWPHKQMPPEYITQYRHCPCGNPTPCPIHESEEFGPFPDWFWKLSPHSVDYAACLRDRNLPYRNPTEYL
jgi:hypothetical protein